MSSSSEYDSESSSSEEELQKPIFISKKNKNKTQNEILKGEDVVVTKRDITMQKIEQNIKTQEDIYDENDDFDGIDDTDDVDVEAEYLAWKEREKQRRIEERIRLKEVEDEKNERVRRAINEEQIDEKPIQLEQLKKLGAFFQGEDTEKFLKRDYSKIEDSTDHSRPTRFKK